VNSSFIPDWLFQHAGRDPAAPAVATPSRRLSYGELAARVRAFAGHLTASGLRSGDRILIALPNTPAAIVAGLAAQTTGAAAVEVNRESSADVLAGIIEETGVRQAVILGRDARLWTQVRAAGRLQRLWVMHGSMPDSLRTALGGAKATLLLEDGSVDPDVGPAPAPLSVTLHPESPALVLYTSGTSSRPRGVVQTFRNIDANTRSIVQYLGLSATDRALLVLPLHYCYGRSVLQTHLFAGGSVFLEPRTAFPRVVLESLSSESCTGMAGVPLTFEIIRRKVDLSTLSFPRLRYLTQAGGAMASDTIAWVRRSFHPAELFVMYGQTEATARLSYLPPARAVDKQGSIGIAIPGVELQIVDEQGRELRRGESGHLVARGDNVTTGYLDDPEETLRILHDGWLWTGDLACRDDDGFFYHQGRSKEILKIGGHRVSPVEIEEVIARHPDIVEAAVIGVKEELVGEEATAFVVPHEGKEPREGELQRFCREHLAAYKVPARFFVVDELPRNEAGKVLRAELRARHAAKRMAKQQP